jgi:uncharacterized protein
MGSVVSIRRVADGLTNLWSRLGSGADRNARNHYTVPVLTQLDVEAAYRSSWLTRKVHDLVPFEMTRAGRDWQASKEQITALEGRENALRLWAKLRSALTTARLHGGAAIILGVRQGMPDQPLVVDRLGKGTLRYAVVVSRHQLHAPLGFDTDPESDFFGQPAMYEMRGPKNTSVRIHPSRVIPFHGAPLPPGSMMMSAWDAFWGDPLLVSIKSAIDNAEVSQAAVATLLHEIKQDVISIPGLTEQIATQGSEELLAKRVEAINRFKGMFNALLLDGGDGPNDPKEEWNHRQVNFSQHPELLRQFVAIVGGAADIPVTRLMGESPGGMQSTGKGEQDDFNRMIGARQSAELAPALLRLDEILIRDALGSRPDEITSVFAPLAEPDAKEGAEVEKLEAETIETYSRTALIPPDALAKAAANRLIESGRWPGLEKAIEESDRELGEEPEPAEPPLLPVAANENDVQEMQRRGAITRDQALLLLTDASPRSLYVRRDLLNRDEFDAWAKEQGFATTVSDPHVTIIHSRTPIDWMKAGSDYWGDDKDGTMVVRPGGARIVEKLGDKGAVVLLFASHALGYRHEKIKRAGAQSDYAEYQPHVTITYRLPPGLDLEKVKPFRGELRFGPEIFEPVDDTWRESVTEA